MRINHSKPLPNLVGPIIGDPFSSSLAILSYNLRELRLRAMVDESLFWPGKGFRTDLEVLEIMFHVACPDGQWYFRGPRGEGSDVSGFEVTEECYLPFVTSDADEEMDELHKDKGARYDSCWSNCFRVAPNDVKLRPFLKSFAKSAARMHALKAVLIWTPLCWDPGPDFDYIAGTEDMAWGIDYEEPGLRS